MKYRANLIPVAMLALAACQPKKASSVMQTNKQELIPVCVKAPSVEAAYLTGLPTPVLRSRIGNSQMTVSTYQPEAQRWFDQGLNLLHDFMYFDAYRAFVQAAKSDSTCAMAYWGIVMSLPGAIDEAKQQRQEALKRALRLPASVKEKAFIQLAEALVAHGFTTAIPLLEGYIKRILTTWKQ